MPQAEGLCRLSVLAIGNSDSVSGANTPTCPVNATAAPRFVFSLPCVKRQEESVQGSLKGPAMALYTQMQRRLEQDVYGM
jgi:hypothetical protein